MVDNDGSKTPVTPPTGESKAQKQESVTDDSSKTSQRKVGIYLLVGGLIVVAVAVYCSIFPPPVDWVGMGASEQKFQVATEEVNGVVTKTTTTQKTDPSKTLWDWMSLLLAPATLAGFGFWFQSSQEQAKADREAAEKKAEKASKDEAEKQAREEKERAEKQAREEKERAEDRQREDALENYINSISDLLIGKGLSTLIKQKERSTLKERQEDLLDAGLDVIRARTLSMLRRLTDEKDSRHTDAGRKGSTLLFLYDTGLIKRQALLSLSDADLSGADLSDAKLSSVGLSSAILSNAYLSRADLSYADLSRAILSSAILSDAKLSDADLSGADLSRAILSSAILNDADCRGANLINAHLSNTILSNTILSYADCRSAILSYANLINANLSRANLSDANLINANLSYANLSYAYFSDAILSRANLSYADFRGAKLINTDLSCANLGRANLSYAVLLRVDLRGAEELTQQQLEGENPPLLCNVTLPNEIGVVPNRDCEKIPQALLDNFPGEFENLAKAQAFVDKYSKP